MRQQGSFLSSLARSLTGAYPEPNDADISIPNAILPTLETGFAHSPGNNWGVGTTNEYYPPESFFNFLIADRAAAGGSQTTRIFALSAGLWNVDMHGTIVVPSLVNQITVFCNFMTAPPDLTGVQNFNWFDMVGSGAGILTMLVDRSSRFFIPKGYILRFEVIVNNTGGASTAVVRLFFNCRRLL